MMLNRRTFLVGASAVTAVRPMLSLSAQETVTSGGIGLTLADVQSIYEELPPGQGFSSFAEPQSGTELFIDFGDDDFAQNIWVYGELDEPAAMDLIIWLCPDDIQQTHLYQILTAAGSIAYEKMREFNSSFLKGFAPTRQNLVAKYVLEPSQLVVTNLMLTVEQEGGGRRDNATMFRTTV